MFGPILKYRKNKSANVANLPIFQGEEVTSPLISGPAWTLRLQFTKYQKSYAPMNFFLILFIFFLFIFLFIYLFYFIFFFFCNSTYTISGALNYTGASLCATSYNLPRAYKAPLSGALVLTFHRKLVLTFHANCLPWKK